MVFFGGVVFRDSNFLRVFLSNQVMFFTFGNKTLSVVSTNLIVVSTSEKRICFYKLTLMTYEIQNIATTQSLKVTPSPGQLIS